MTTTDQPIKKIKAIAKDDFAYYLNGELVGYAPTYLQAQAALNDLVYNLLSRGNVTGADLAPDEAEAVLEGQQLAALPYAPPAISTPRCGECDTTGYLGNGQCCLCGAVQSTEAEAAQRELVELERQAGVEETRECYRREQPGARRPVLTRTISNWYAWVRTGKGGVDEVSNTGGYPLGHEQIEQHNQAEILARITPPDPEPTTTNAQRDEAGDELAAMLEAETALRDYAAFVAAPDSEAEAVCEWAAAMVRARIDCAGLLTLYPALGIWRRTCGRPSVRPAEWLPFQACQHAA